LCGDPDGVPDDPQHRGRAEVRGLLADPHHLSAQALAQQGSQRIPGLMQGRPRLSRPDADADHASETAAHCPGGYCSCERRARWLWPEGTYLCIKEFSACTDWHRPVSAELQELRRPGGTLLGYRGAAPLPR
jgi:hypothetical protein